jgi:hypothetical protein
VAAFKKPWTAVGAVILVLAGAVALFFWSRPDVKQAIGGAANRGVAGLSNAVNHGLAGLNGVAAMIAARSPGERPEGELASLKHKRQAVPHERALAKVRRAAPGTLASIVGPPAVPPVVVPPIAATPLFNAVAAPPVVPAQTPVTGGPPGGFPAIVPLPGGGGLIFPPAAPTPGTPGTPGSPGTPGTPGTPAAPVPEPSTWAMMLLGLVLMGRIVGRSRGMAAGG